MAISQFYRSLVNPNWEEMVCLVPRDLDVVYDSLVPALVFVGCFLGVSGLDGALVVLLLVYCLIPIDIL